ncbi:MAG: serine/threonine protein kinase [Myxococcota bacterium]
MTLQYEIIERVAAGGMAEVYRARAFDDSGVGGEVCIKRILPHLTQDPRSLSMFVDEARLAANLNCNQIVQVYDLCMSPTGEHFIVMEYVDGMDLARFLSTCRDQGIQVPVPVATRVAVQICKGLQYAHDKTDESGRSLRVIHRDISPQNVLLSRTGEVKITDFGIAKSAIVMTTTAVGILKGKYGYMSPEQASGLELDQRSDLFNVGILLYEMLVGERCFAGESDHSTLELMREAQVVPPRRLRHDINPDLERVVLKALSRDRRDRFASAHQLEQAIILCPGAFPADADTLAAFIRRLEDLSQSPRREETGVLSLASIVSGPDDASSGVSSSRPAASNEEAEPRRPVWFRSRPPIQVFGMAAATLLAFLLARFAASTDPLRAVQLGPSPPSGNDEVTMLIDTVPSGARVIFDGVEMAGETPLILDRPRDDVVHEIEVFLKGQGSQTHRLSYGDGAFQAVRLKLADTSTVPMALVRFRTFPDSELWIHGRRRAMGREGEVKIPALRPVLLSFRGPEGQQADVEVELGDGAVRDVVVDLESPAY